MNAESKMENVKRSGVGGLRIVVGEGSCGIAAGARKVRGALEALNGNSGNAVDIGVTGCIGMCFLEPIVDLYYGERGTGNGERGTGNGERGSPLDSYACRRRTRSAFSRRLSQATSRGWKT